MFVSYSRLDSAFVLQLADELRQRDKDVWVDVEGIRDAEVFPDALRRAIEGSDVFLFVISPASVKSEFCEQEVAHASSLNKRIVPLALRAVPDAEIPEQIRFRNWIPVGEDGQAAADTTVERVVAALDTDLEWEQQHTRITVRALQWEKARREASFLLRGAELAAAERWLTAGAGKDPGPTVLEQEFLLAGRHAAARRQRTLLGASVIVAVIAIGLLVFALISRGQEVTAKTSAQAQALAAVSETQQSVDPERAVLLAMAAVRTRVTYGTLGTMFALRAALDASTIRYRLPPVGVQACGGLGAAYDPRPGSNLLAEGTCDGSIVLANATTGKVERRIHLTGGPTINLQYTGDGSALVVAVAGTNTRLLELDPTNGRVRREAPPIPRFEGFTVNPRATVVAIVSAGALDFWSLTTGRLTVTHPQGVLTTLQGFTYTPDGRDIAAVSSADNVPGPGLVLYDIARQRIIATEPVPASVIAFSPDGSELALGENLPAGGGIVVLNTRTLAVDRRFTQISAPDVEPSALAFSPDGTQLAYGFADGTAGLVSASTGQTIDTYLGDTAMITAVSVTPDGKLVATASSDGAVRLASRRSRAAARHRRCAQRSGRGRPGWLCEHERRAPERGSCAEVVRWRRGARRAARTLADGERRRLVPVPGRTVCRRDPRSPEPGSPDLRVPYGAARAVERGRAPACADDQARGGAVGARAGAERRRELDGDERAVHQGAQRPDPARAGQPPHRPGAPPPRQRQSVHRDLGRVRLYP